MIDPKTLKIKVAVKTAKGEYLAMFPDAPEERIYPICDFLKELFYSINGENGTKFLMILIKDFPYYRKKFLSRNFNTAIEVDKANRDIDAFLEYISLDADVLTPDNKIVKLRSILNEFTEVEKTQLYGAYLFFFALLRYTSSELDQSDVTGFTTSLEASAMLNTSTKL